MQRILGAVGSKLLAFPKVLLHRNCEGVGNLGEVKPGHLHWLGKTRGHCPQESLLPVEKVQLCWSVQFKVKPK